VAHSASKSKHSSGGGGGSGNAGGNTASFTPAATSGTVGYWAGNGSGNYLTCKLARFRVFPVALNPDQARAELDALTAAYKIG
jgi:hypothetical protein